MKNRTILHVDMDAFFASVELLRHPELRGKPLIVGGCGDPHQRGVVSTASYEARRYGITSGMPLRRAYHACPQAVFLPVDDKAYVEVSKSIKAILHQYASHLEDVGLDEAFLDISSSGQSAIHIATSIKQRIRTETGLTCSVGIGPNKLLAKIASDLEKPDGLTVLQHSDVPTRLWPLPVRKLWGVGPKTEASLARLGVYTVGELAALPQASLVKHFGPAHGHSLFDAARGLDESPVISHRRRKSISREITFQRDITDWSLLDSTLEELIRSVVGRLRQYHYLASGVSVKLRFSDFETLTRSQRLESNSDDLVVIQAAVHHCLERFVLSKPVRLLGVRLERLQVRSRMR